MHAADGHPLSVQQPAYYYLKQVTFFTVGTMVSMWFLVKVFVTFAPLTGVVAQYPTAPQLPELLDATADELIAGLEAGQFTSLDLVQVGTTSHFMALALDLLTYARRM